MEHRPGHAWRIRSNPHVHGLRNCALFWGGGCGPLCSSGGAATARHPVAPGLCSRHIRSRQCCAGNRHGTGGSQDRPDRSFADRSRDSRLRGLPQNQHNAPCSSDPDKRRAIRDNHDGQAFGLLSLGTAACNSRTRIVSSPARTPTPEFIPWNPRSQSCRSWNQTTVLIPALRFSIEGMARLAAKVRCGHPAAFGHWRRGHPHQSAALRGHVHQGISHRR